MTEESGTKKPRGKRSGVPMSATWVKNVSKPGRYGDGRGGFGLSLLVKKMKNGRWSKTWSQRLWIRGEYVTRGLGSYPKVSLAMARDIARERAIRVAEGEDIRQPQRKVLTVADAFDTVIALRSPSWTSTRTIDWWRLAQEVFEPISSKLVSDVASSDVREALAPLWHKHNKKAREVRSILSTVMRWAIDEGWRVTNPAGPGVTQPFGKAQRPVHYQSLDPEDLGRALAVIMDADIWWAAKLCIIFLALTCVRSGEARGAAWDEIDLDKAVWTIPASRMKNGEEHLVPLATEVLEVLYYALDRTDGQGLVFPREGGGCMDSKALSGIFLRLEIPAVPHGLRSSFSNWAGAQPHIAVSVAEMVLSHKPKSKVEEAYRTSKFFKERVPVMQEWAAFVAETMGPVVPA